MDNLTKQIEEIESLISIYGQELQIEDEQNKAYSINITSELDSHIYVKLYIKFPDSYPSFSPPIFQISAPYLKQETKVHFRNLTENIYLESVGQSIVFQCIEKIREELQSSVLKSLNPHEEEELKRNETKLLVNQVQDTCLCPIIHHGEVIVDRKSSFQGHAAIVLSILDVKQVLNKLKENRKIQQATHNIYAFIIQNENNNNIILDCDDDGESQAGNRLLHLLKIMKIKNAIVIVSRWYGGTHLGPDRFRHINNAARCINSVATCPEVLFSPCCRPVQMYVENEHSPAPDYRLLEKPPSQRKSCSFS